MWWLSQSHRVESMMGSFAMTRLSRLRDRSRPCRNTSTTQSLHLSIHHDNEDVAYLIRPLSRMPTPRQVYVAVIGMTFSRTAPPCPAILFHHPLTINNQSPWTNSTQVSAVLENASLTNSRPFEPACRKPHLPPTSISSSSRARQKSSSARASAH